MRPKNWSQIRPGHPKTHPAATIHQPLGVTRHVVVLLRRGCMKSAIPPRRPSKQTPADPPDSKTSQAHFRTELTRTCLHKDFLSREQSYEHLNLQTEVLRLNATEFLSAPRPRVPAPRPFLMGFPEPGTVSTQKTINLRFLSFGTIRRSTIVLAPDAQSVARRQERLKKEKTSPAVGGTSSSAPSASSKSAAPLFEEA